MALYYLAALTGAPEPLERGIRLLREELVHAEPSPVDALGFRMSRSDRRNMPYLACCAAGYVHVLARYLTRRPDPELAETLRRCLRTVSIRITAAPGLFFGQSGLALVHAEAAASLPEHDAPHDEPTRLTALFKHAVPHHSGVRWPGSHGSRLSADLWTGSAGVLLALHHALTGTTDPLFTLDRYLDDTPASGKFDGRERRENHDRDSSAAVAVGSGCRERRTVEHAQPAELHRRRRRDGGGLTVGCSTVRAGFGRVPVWAITRFPMFLPK